MTETFTLYKLIILYMLSRVDFPLTTSQISEFILDKEYTTYFKLQGALSELTDSGLIRPENINNRTLYHLTEEGEKIILFFPSRISPDIRREINEYFREKQLDLKEDVSVKTDYRQDDKGDWNVRCRITEDGYNLIDLTLTVPTETEAKTIANNWTAKNQSLYQFLLSQLL